MVGSDILEKVLQLRPEERSRIVDGILRSLDEPDPRIDQIWTEEAERRLEAYRSGRIGGVPAEEVFPKSE